MPASDPRLPALRLARRRVADAARALRRPFARDLRRGARHLRAHRAREVRAVQPHWSTPRSRGSTARRCILPQATHDAHKAYVESGMLSAAQDYEIGGMQLPYTRRGGGQQLLRDGLGQHRLGGMLTERQRQPADGARHRRCRRRCSPRTNSPAASPAPCACRSRRRARRCRDVATRAVPDGADFESDPLGPRYRLTRQQDVDLDRRARADREHRPPRAGQDPRTRRQAGSGHARHLAVHRAQEAGRHATASSPANATTSRSPA